MSSPRRRQPARAFDASELIDSPSMVAAYLDEAMSDGEPKILLAALRDVLRSRVFSEIAATAGVRREASVQWAMPSPGSPRRGGRHQN